MTSKTEETQQPPSAPEKLPWTKPVLESAGTIRDVAGGGSPGLDGNSLPAALAS